MCLRPLGVIIFCALALALAGGPLGLALSLAAPDHPLVGFGPGALQGLAWGSIVGSIGALLAACFEAPGEADHPRPPSAGLWLFLASVATLSAAVGGGAVGFVVDEIVGNIRLYQQMTDVKLDKIRPVLQQDPRFARVETDCWSAARVYLLGEVDSEATRDELKDRMRFLFGDEEAGNMVYFVQVAEDKN